MHHLRNVVCIFFVAGLFGCALPVRDKGKTAEDLLGPNGKQPSASKTGLALAGGGTKAAAYSMGVLTAISESASTRQDSNNSFRRFDAISSVSGGGYAAFFLYSKLLSFPLINPTEH